MSIVPVWFWPISSCLGKNGYEVCETIKNDPELQSIPVILLVGAFEPFDGHEAARVRADSHLTKPFEIKALISAVRTLIETAEQQAAAKTEPEGCFSVTSSSRRKR